MNKIKIERVLGFYSIIIAWTLLTALQASYLDWGRVRTQYDGILIGWAPIFTFILWLVFVIWPMSMIDPFGKVLKTMFFLLITILFNILAYVVLVGVLSDSLDIVVMFLPLAILAGLGFGTFYCLLVRSNKVTAMIHQKPFFRGIFFFFPIALSFILVWVAPATIPQKVFLHIPDPVKQKIVTRTIPKHKQGDDFVRLQKALPGYFDHFKNGTGAISQTLGDFTFSLLVEGNKIVKIEYTYL